MTTHRFATVAELRAEPSLARALEALVHHREPEVRRAFARLHRQLEEAEGRRLALRINPAYTAEGLRELVLAWNDTVERRAQTPSRTVDAPTEGASEPDHEDLAHRFSNLGTRP